MGSIDDGFTGSAVGRQWLRARSANGARERRCIGRGWSSFYPRDHGAQRNGVNWATLLLGGRPHHRHVRDRESLEAGPGVDRCCQAGAWRVKGAWGGVGAGGVLLREGSLGHHWSGLVAHLSGQKRPLLLAYPALSGHTSGRHTIRRAPPPPCAPLCPPRGARGIQGPPGHAPATVKRPLSVLLSYIE